jgi:hypothetical protein
MLIAVAVAFWYKLVRYDVEHRTSCECESEGDKTLHRFDQEDPSQGGKGLD